jgi:hypothetical protein
MARYFLAVSGPDDPRYNDLLRGFLAGSHPSFDPLLWPALFSRCEQEYGLSDYAIFLAAMLQEVGSSFYPQQVLVAGHMTLGVATKLLPNVIFAWPAPIARPREAGRYLLFDTARPIKRVEELLPGLGSVFGS